MPLSSILILYIGDGAFGQVFKVKRLSDNQEYALKKVFSLFKLTFIGKINQLIRKRKRKCTKWNKNFSFSSVWYFLSLTNHYFRNINIVSYKESFFDDATNSLCIVMDYADGGDLYNKIVNLKKKNTLMSEKDIWHFFVQMVRGL